MWFVASCLQASFSNLLPDEALYWMYSKHLAWGYYEHAPGIAPVIKAGYELLQSQLGVRIFPIIMMCGAIYLLEKIVVPRKLISFYLAVSSFAAIHILGILAVPDALLFFFSVSFLYLYKQYLLRDQLWIAVLLGINVACLLLSKYHGILIILFTLLSNIKLLTQ